MANLDPHITHALAASNLPSGSEFRSISDFMALRRLKEGPELAVAPQTAVTYLLWWHVEENVAQLLSRIEHALDVQGERVRRVTVLEENTEASDAKEFDEAVLNDYLADKRGLAFQEWAQGLSREMILKYLALTFPERSSFGDAIIGEMRAQLGVVFDDRTQLLAEGFAKVAQERGIEFRMREIDLEDPEQIESSDRNFEEHKAATDVYRAMYKPTVGQLVEQFGSLEQLSEELFAAKRKEILASAQAISGARNAAMIRQCQHFSGESSSDHVIFVLCGAGHTAVPYAHFLNGAAPVAGLEYVVLPEAFLAAAPARLRHTFPLAADEVIAVECAEHPDSIETFLGRQQICAAILQDRMTALLQKLASQCAGEFGQARAFLRDAAVCEFLAKCFCDHEGLRASGDGPLLDSRYLDSRQSLENCFTLWCLNKLRDSFPECRTAPEFFEAMVERYVTGAHS